MKRYTEFIPSAPRLLLFLVENGVHYKSICVSNPQKTPTARHIIPNAPTLAVSGGKCGTSLLQWLGVHWLYQVYVRNQLVLGLKKDFLPLLPSFLRTTNNE